MDIGHGPFGYSLCRPWVRPVLRFKRGETHRTPERFKSPGFTFYKSDGRAGLEPRLRVTDSTAGMLLEVALVVFLGGIEGRGFGNLGGDSLRVVGWR